MAVARHLGEREPAAAAAEAVVHSIRAAEGELRFTLDLPETTHDLWIRTSAPVVPTADVAAVAALLPAMAAADALRVEAPVGEATLDSMREAQAILRSWARSGAWLRALPFDREIALHCPVAEQLPRITGGSVATFFSGGVDSLSTVLRHPETTHLIHVVGFDTRPEQEPLNKAIRERLAAAAGELGKELITVETNLREMSDRHVRWPVYFGSAMGAVALLLADRFSRVLIASGVSYGTVYENGSHPLLDRLWGADRVEVVHDGAGFTRTEKLEALAYSDVARRTLRVCWLNPDESYNCGRCEKCLRAMVALEALGVRERFETLPGALDLGDVAAIRPENRPEADYWRENLALAIREQAEPALIEAIETCIGNAMPVSQPAGRRRGAERYPDPRLLRPSLYVDPETCEALESSRSIVFLVGGCDGWANFGDVAQLQAAADLFSSLDPSIAALPVIDPRAHGGWAQLGLRGSGGFDPARPVYFAQPVDGLDGIVAELDLVPLGIPQRVRTAATWLYGGGYLNRRWGRRKLLTARATEAICRRWGVEPHPLLSSGLQIEPDWFRRLDPELRELAARFLQLGARDELSAQAAAELAAEEAQGPAIVRTGDDAVGLLARLRPKERHERRPGDAIVLNVHVSPGDWVSRDARDDGRLPGALRCRARTGDRPRGPAADRLRRSGADHRAAGLDGAGRGHCAPPARRQPRPGDAACGRRSRSLRRGSPACGPDRVLLLPRGADLAHARGTRGAGPRQPLLRPEGGRVAARLLASGRDVSPPRRRSRGGGRESRVGGRPGDGGRDGVRAWRCSRAGRPASCRDRGRPRRRALEAGRITPDHRRRPAVVPVADYEALSAASGRAYAKAKALAARAAWAESRLEDIEASDSWRLTRPLRRAKRLFRS